MNVEFLRALEEIEKEKGIPKELLIEAIEAALISAYKRNFGSAQNVAVDIDRSSGEVHVYSRKNVVEEVLDPTLEISLQDAQAKNPNYEIGDIVDHEVTPANFGRIAAQTAKQVVVQRIREAERGIIFSEYQNREGDILTGIVQRWSKQNVVIDMGKTEALLIPSEQMKTDKYESGTRIKVFIVEVKETTKGPRILVSRTHPGLLKRLFELEVPEIFDGVVELKAVAREAGSRSKIAVYSRNEDVDPVGACVGPRGMRVQAVVNELCGEKIDIVEWSPDPATFVSNALSPAKVLSVNIFESEGVAQVVVPDYQLSLAIGKEGQNARLAAKLTNWKVDIKSVSQAEQKPFDNPGGTKIVKIQLENKDYRSDFEEDGDMDYLDSPMTEAYHADHGRQLPGETEASAEKAWEENTEA